MTLYTRAFLERALLGPSRLPLKKGGTTVKYRSTPWTQRISFTKNLRAAAKKIKAKFAKPQDDKKPPSSLVDKRIAERRQRLREKYSWKPVKKPRWLRKTFVDTRESRYEKPEATIKKERTVHFGSKPDVKVRTVKRFDHDDFAWWHEHGEAVERDLQARIEEGSDDSFSEDDFF